MQPDSGELVPTNEEVIAGNGTMVQDNGEVTPDIGTMIPNNGEVILDNEEVIPENIKVTSDNESVIPDKGVGKVTPDKGTMIPSNGEVIHVLDNEKVIPENKKVTSDKGEVITDKGEVIPDKGEVIPDKGEVILDKGEVIPDKGEVIPDKGEVIPDKGEVIPDKGEVTGEKASVEQVKSVMKRYIGTMVDEDIEMIPCNGILISEHEETKSDNSQMSLDGDEILRALGGCGRYQVLVFLALSFIYMRGTWQVLVILYAGASPAHQCLVPAPDNQTRAALHPEGQCHITGTWVDGENMTKTCQFGYLYDDAYYKSTIVTEWDLVCGKDYLVELSTTVYMIGNSCGALFLMPLSDRFGRKWLMLLFLLLQTAVGVGVTFVTSIIAFTTLRFFVGFFNMAIALMTYVMMTEVFAASHRTRPSVCVSLFWSLGLMLLAVFGYLVRDWRHLELLVSLPNLLALTYIWWIPESIPWLVSKGETQRVEQIVKCAVKVNNLPFPSELFQTVPDTEEEETGSAVHCTPGVDGTGTRAGQTGYQSVDSQLPLANTDNKADTKDGGYVLLKLFKTTLLRRYTLILFYLWFVNSLGYFGILFSTPTLHGNPYINLGISGAVEIPAVLICMGALDYVGRRRPLIVFLLICGVMNILTMFIPEKTESGVDLVPLIITMAMIGKFGITGAYTTVYLYSSEIYPTVIRNQAVGLSSFFENVGGIAAPFIVYGAKSLARLPLVLFGVLTIVGAILTVFLPETHRQPLPETIEEVENRGHCKHTEDRPLDNTASPHG